jgi:hypothetical protein
MVLAARKTQFEIDTFMLNIGPGRFLGGHPSPSRVTFPASTKTWKAGAGRRPALSLIRLHADSYPVKQLSYRRHPAYAHNITG